MTVPNYIRTLLLNQTRGANAGTPGEEYVAADFIPSALTQPLHKVRTLLLGGTEDRHTLNYRLYQLMQMLHASELAEFVTYHDARITYLPFSHSELFEDLSTPDLSDIVLLAQQTLSSADTTAIFVGSSLEPMQTFWRLWSQNDLYPYKLGGLVLALAWQLHELQN
jgi:hypothetical protein